MRFTDPSQTPEQEQGGTYVNPKDLVGHLLLIWPIRYETDVPTKYPRLDGKPSDAVFCDVVVVSMKDENGTQGLVMRQTRWTQGRLIRDTKHFLGIADPLLKSMGKDGDAYTLIDQVNNAVAVKMATEWADANPGFVPGDAVPPAAARDTEQQDPWQQGARTPAQQAGDRLLRQAQNTPFPVSSSLPPVPSQEETPPF